MSTVISVENVSKAYRLGLIGGGTLKEDFARWCAKLQGKPDPTLKIGEEHHARRMGETFWALKDISFQVKEGEVLGIIGRNGAGKSTLLKILSQVTSPTSGEIKIKGRIASLLEVGTGFHPELTGRENVFLNGAILGMTKAEIRKKFDEIVAFAGIDEFIDSPVKRYSSGMYVRLAFAVAAHLEPEILIVDEVLAVGDAEFQKKCLGKIQAVSRGGRTVLFVSHNMDAVQRLCTSTVLLQGGRLLRSGSAQEIISLYFNEKNSQNRVVDLQKSPRDANQRGDVRLLNVEVENGGASNWKLPCGERIGLVFKIEARRAVGAIDLGIGLFNSTGVEIASATSSHNREINISKPGIYEVIFRYKDLSLISGQYRFGVGIRSDRGNEDYLPEAFSLEIIPSDYSAQSNADGFRGCIIPAVEIAIQTS